MAVSLRTFVPGTKNGSSRNKYVIKGHEEPYFVKEHSDSHCNVTGYDIIKMIEVLVENSSMVFAGTFSNK